MAVRRNRTLLGLVTGGGALVFFGFLIGTGISGDETESQVTARPPTSLSTTAPSIDLELSTADAEVERILGTTSGGGPSVVSMSFTASRRWRIDHDVRVRSAAIRLFEPSTGLVISYRAPVGKSTRYFYRGCTCQVAAGSRGGAFTVTIVDTAE